MKKQLVYAVLMISFSGMIHAQSIPVSLEFSYDAAGNQIKWQRETGDKEIDTVREVDTIPASIIDLEESIENRFHVTPNPTTGEVVLQWKAGVAEQITTIELVSLISSEKLKVTRGAGTTTSIDLTGKAPGVYLIIFYLNNPETPTVQKKIIKI